MERLGITFGGINGAQDLQMISAASIADKLGYESLWIGESWGRDAFTLLTMVACHTSNIKLGTGIVTVYGRTPAMTAQSIASLDVISNGRAILGLGSSGRLVVEQWHGIKYVKPLERTREYVDIIRMILSGQRANFEGNVFQLGRFKLPFAPVQENIPIFMASMGKNNLILTGQIADGWLPTMIHMDHFAEMKSMVEQGIVKSGRSIDRILVAPSILTYVSRNQDDYRSGMRLIKSHLAYYIGGMGQYYFELFTRYGYEIECIRIREAWSSGDRQKAASLIPLDMIDKVAIIGDTLSCKEKLAIYRNLGIDVPILAFPHSATIDAIIHTLEQLAPT